MHEPERLDILKQYGILDTPYEEPFERIAALAELIFDAPIVLISLLDDSRQWFKSNIGLNFRETPREHALCNETICSDDVLVVADTRRDVRTAQNPFVTGKPHVAFYAGAPLITPEKARLGSLCIMDHEPRQFDERQTAILQSLAGLVMKEMELRRQTDYDWLTGATSRRAFQGTLERLVGRSAYPSIGLISFDIDHFKQVNDRFGHLAGDRVLVEVVEVCRSVVAGLRRDFAARGRRIRRSSAGCHSQKRAWCGRTFTTGHRECATIRYRRSCHGKLWGHLA